MKKVLFSLVAFIAFCANVTAQEVKADNAEAKPGETATVQMYIDTNGGTYTGLEFDIEFPISGFTTGKATNNLTNWNPTIAIGEVGKLIENTARCGAQDMNDNGTPMPGEGMRPFISVNIIIGSDVDYNDYTIKLTNMTLIKKEDGGRVSVPDASFTLSVVDYITLDENSTVAPSAASDVKVKVKRTINAGNWSTIVLPFDMTEDQVKAAFGDKVQLKDFTGYDFDEDADVINVNFAEVSPVAIEKNHPYIIKVEKAVTDFLVEGVTIDPGEKQPMKNVGEKDTKGKIKAFIGTYVADFDLADNAKNYALFLSGNKFWYATEDTQHMKAFRGYFDFCDTPAYIDDAMSRFVLHFDDASGISTPTVIADGEYYNLNGLRVETPTKGVYIKDGKKVVVK